MLYYASTPMDIIKRLETYRLENKISQQDLAAKLGGGFLHGQSLAQPESHTKQDSDIPYREAAQSTARQWPLRETGKRSQEEWYDPLSFFRRIAAAA